MRTAELYRLLEGWVVAGMAGEFEDVEANDDRLLLTTTDGRMYRLVALEIAGTDTEEEFPGRFEQATGIDLGPPLLELIWKCPNCGCVIWPDRDGSTFYPDRYEAICSAAVGGGSNCGDLGCRCHGVGVLEATWKVTDIQAGWRVLVPDTGQEDVVVDSHPWEDRWALELRERGRLVLHRDLELEVTKP
jgi:hypothetical protein